jgi:hypothetical protein
MGLLDKPRRLWWRKAIFQIHLWVGLVLCLDVLAADLSRGIALHANLTNRPGHALISR